MKILFKRDILRPGQAKENGNTIWLNIGFNSKFPVIYLNRDTPDESRGEQRSKLCDSNNKVEGNKPHVNSVIHKISWSLQICITYNYLVIIHLSGTRPDYLGSIYNSFHYD